MTGNLSVTRICFNDRSTLIKQHEARERARQLADWSKSQRLGHRGQDLFGEMVHVRGILAPFYSCK